MLGRTTWHTLGSIARGLRGTARDGAGRRRRRIGRRRTDVLVRLLAAAALAALWLGCEQMRAMLLRGWGLL